MLASISPDLWVIAGVLAVVVVGLLTLHSLVLIETIKQIGQIRYRLDVDDKPIFISLGDATGRSVTSIVEPGLEQNLLARAPNLLRGAAALVFLSTDCRTCRMVAEGLLEVSMRHSEKLTVLPIVDCRDSPGTEDFLASARLSATDVLLDDGSFAKAVGVTARPTVVVLRHGLIREAATVNNATQLSRLADDVTALHIDDRERWVNNTHLTNVPIGG